MENNYKKTAWFYTLILFAIIILCNCGGKTRYARTNTTVSASPSESTAQNIPTNSTSDTKNIESTTPVERSLLQLYNFYNESIPNDVDNDGRVTPSDLLIITNRVNNINLPSKLDPVSIPPTYYFDVNNDGYVNCIDSIVVMSELNRSKSILRVTGLVTDGLSNSPVSNSLVQLRFRATYYESCPGQVVLDKTTYTQSNGSYSFQIDNTLFNYGVVDLLITSNNYNATASVAVGSRSSYFPMGDKQEVLNLTLHPQRQ